MVAEHAATERPTIPCNNPPKGGNNMEEITSITPHQPARSGEPTMTDPKLAAALAALMETQNALPLMAIAFQAREAASNGRYCECSTPELAGADLLCGACLLNNKDQERSRVRAFAHAHDFVPDGAMGGAFCKACVRLERDPRHHGQNAVGVTSWGEEV